MTSTVSQTSWDRRFLELATAVAGWSKDPDEGVGALVVSADKRQFSVGYNGFPRGSDLDDRIRSKTEKNRLTIHAERNALDNASFNLAGSTIYVTKAPCFECMKGLIQTGVVRVVSFPLDRRSRWHGDCLDARHLAADHNIRCEELD